MVHMLAEAEPRPPYEVIPNDRHIEARELDTLTAVVLGVWRYSDGRQGARINAYVDGRGHRTLQVELPPEDYDRAVESLQRPGVLLRCSGVVVDHGPCPHLLAAEGLQLLVPHDSHG
jgi:hypothetical protein